jgi:hypothetical protein
MSGRRSAGVLVGIALIALARPLLAQAKLTGTVRDTTGAPIAGVEVTVQGTSRAATTDRTGAFAVEGLAAGTASVMLRRLGYAPQTSILKLAEGENSLGDIVLTALPRELDTVQVREALWREYPLLREFEENRKVGLGQFVTRQQLAMQTGGFMTPIFGQLRGVSIIRSARVASHAWVANTLVPTTNCTALEDRMDGEQISPTRDADCNYCFPTVFLDNSRLTPLGVAANVGRFSPDQIEAMEVYLGAAETPAKYSGLRSGCGVIVLITRVVQRKPRAIAVRQDHPTRSRLFVNASVSTGKSGADCSQCGGGTATDFRLGYTLSDRWAIAARVANWSGAPDSVQSIRLRQVLVEWYPHPDPGRIKWFLNAGLGQMSADVFTNSTPEKDDHYTGEGMPAMVVGTGLDLALVQRIVATPFFSYNRNLGGKVDLTHCVNHIPTGTTTWVRDCHSRSGEPRTFTLAQVGVRLGWR